MSNDAVINRLFWSAEACFILATVVLCVAEFVVRRPVPIPVPSIYWPVASLRLRGSRRMRRLFRLLIGDLYRKRLWNPTFNSLLKQKGFERQRHLSSCNIHAGCSAMVLTLVAFFLYHRLYGAALVLAAFELVFNTPAIILSRYLYLLTLRRGSPTLTPKRSVG